MARKLSLSPVTLKPARPGSLASALRFNTVLPADLYSRLTAAAYRQGVTRASIVRKAIDMYLSGRIIGGARHDD